MQRNHENLYPNLYHPVDEGDGDEYLVIDESLISSMEVIDDHSSYCCFNVKTCASMLLLCSLVSLGMQYHFTGEYIEVKAIFAFLDQEGLYSNDYVRLGIAAWQCASLLLMVVAMFTWKRFLLIPYCFMQIILIVCETAIFSTCLVFSALDKIEVRLADRMQLIIEMFFSQASEMAALNEPIVLGMATALGCLLLTMINFVIFSILERLFLHLRSLAEPWIDCERQ